MSTSNTAPGLCPPYFFLFAPSGASQCNPISYTSANRYGFNDAGRNQTQFGTEERAESGPLPTGTP